MRSYSHVAAIERLEPRQLLSAVTVGDDSFPLVQASPNETQTFTWDVLGNDSSSAGGLTITSVQSGAAGSAAIVWANPDDPLSRTSVSFALNPDFVGEDFLTYTVTDADGDHGTGTIRLTVTAGDSGDDGPLTLAEQMQQVADQLAQAQADLAAGRARFSDAIAAAQAKLKQQQAADEQQHADALAAAQQTLDEKVNAGHDRAIEAIQAADAAYQQALAERLDAAAAAIAAGQDTLVSKVTEADELYQAQHQAAVDAATEALDSAAAALVAAREAARAAAAGQMAATETAWNAAVTDASAAFETTYAATETALTAAADQAVELFATATDGVASSFAAALAEAAGQRDALLAGLSGATYVTTFSDPAYAAALALADSALNEAIAAARANLESQSTTAMNGYNAATQTAAGDLTTAQQNAATEFAADLHNADVAGQTAMDNAQADYDANAALAQTAYETRVDGAHGDLVTAVTGDLAALETAVNLAESDFKTAANEALAKYSAWVAEAFGTPGTSGTTMSGTMTTGTSMMSGTDTTITGTSMMTATGGFTTTSSTGTTTATLGTFQVAVKADAQAAYDKLQQAANDARDAALAADTAYVTAITADQTAYLGVVGGLQQSLQTAVTTASDQVDSARDAALATYHQVQQQIASTYSAVTTSPMTMEEAMAQSAARQAAEAAAKREFLSTVASAELTAAQTVGSQYVAAVGSERSARATLMVALRHDENVWSETKAAAEAALKDRTDVALARFMNRVTTLEGAYDTAAEQKFTTFKSKVALAEQAVIVADQTAEAAFESALVTEAELEVQAVAAAETAFEHALAEEAQAAEDAIALADQAWYGATGDAEAEWLQAETDAGTAHVAALAAAAQGVDTELSANESAEVTAINAALAAWQTGVDSAWSAAFVTANGETADTTAAAEAFLGFEDSVTSSIAGVMTGFNAAYHALTSSLIADVTAADQAVAAAAQTQTAAVATATNDALHQIGQTVKDLSTAEADAEHDAATAVSDAIGGFIIAETAAGNVVSHTLIDAVTGYTNGLVSTGFGALTGDWGDQATRFGAVTGASVGFATTTIDASGGYETATHAADFESLAATHRREEAQLKSVLNAATSLATAGAAAQVAEALSQMCDDLERLLALDDSQIGAFSPDQMTAVLAARMMIPTNFTGTTSAENISAPNDATPDQLTATESARTLIHQAASTAQGLRNYGVQTAALQMMMGNATSYEDSAWQTINGEGTQMIQLTGDQYAKMQVKAQVVPAVNPVSGAQTWGAAGQQQQLPANSTNFVYTDASGNAWLNTAFFWGGGDLQLGTAMDDQTINRFVNGIQYRVAYGTVVDYAMNNWDTVKNWTADQWNAWFSLNGTPNATDLINAIDKRLSQTLNAFEGPGFREALIKQSQKGGQVFIAFNNMLEAGGNLAIEVISAFPGGSAAKVIAFKASGEGQNLSWLDYAGGAGDLFTVVKTAKGVIVTAKTEEAGRMLAELCESLCFAPDTPVHTSTGCKPIRDVQPGEFVRAFHFERGEWELCEVLVRHDNRYSGAMITVSLGDDSVDATSGHPFWVVSGTELDSRRCPKDFRPDEDQGGSLTGRWVMAADLRLGDRVVGQDGQPCVVTNIATREVNSFHVCNLTIREHHSFGVGRTGMLVHNNGFCNALGDAPKVLKDKIAELGSTFVLHGHHIVQKTVNADLLEKARATLSGLGLGENATAEQVAKLFNEGKLLPSEARTWFINHSQQILKKAGDIPILKEVSDAMKPGANKANLCWAINGWEGIHSTEYNMEVALRLERAVQMDGGAGVRAALTQMGNLLQRAERFWKYVPPVK